MEASPNGLNAMKNDSSYEKDEFLNRRSVEGALNSKKSVRWSSVGTERNVREPFSATYSLFAVCVAFVVSSTLAVEGWLGLGLSWPLEGLSRLVMPGFCFGFILYHLTACFMEFLTSRRLFTLLATILASETVVCLLLGIYLPQYVTNFFVFLGIAIACAYLSVDVHAGALIFVTVSLSRFLAIICFTSVDTAYRPYLGYFFSALGVLLANYSARDRAPKDVHVPGEVDWGSNDNINPMPTPMGNHVSSDDCFNVAPNRRNSLPIIQKPQTNSKNVELLRKAEAALQEMLTSPEVPIRILTQLQALRNLLKSSDAPVVHQRSKSIPLITLSGGSVFSERYADFPYSISENSSYAPQRFRRHYSVVGHCRPSGVWTRNSCHNLNSTGFSLLEGVALDEKSSFNHLDLGSPLSERSSDFPDGFQKTREEDDDRDDVEDLNMDRFLPSETVSRKSSMSSHRSSTRSLHISFADDPTIVDYMSSEDHEVEDFEDEDVPETLSDELQKLLDVDLLTRWDYPIFELAQEASDTMLSKVAHKTFSDLGLLKTFRIPQKQFVSYFHALECGYHEENPYHNRIHATDVLHAVYYMITQPIHGFTQVIPGDYTCEQSDLRTTSLTSKISENGCYGIMGSNFLALELMAMLTAASMHDFDHPGRTNAFLIATCHPLAVLYNNRSVLENHHAASAWSLLISNPQHAWLSNLSDTEFKRFRYLVLDEILATDLVRHFEILADFNAKVNEEIGLGLNWAQEEDRLRVSKVVLKMADISSPCKNWQLHSLWTERIAEEFYQQGDEEHSMQISVSPYMDRAQTQLAKLQESFITHLVAPLCDSLFGAGLLPSSLPENSDTNGDEAKEMEEEDIHRADIVCVMTKNLQDNHSEWVRLMNIDNPGTPPTST